MDFPRNAKTNVHKIEGILFIQWSVYGPEISSNSDADHIRQQPEPRVVDLAFTEHELRRAGNHVLCDDSQGILWVFDLSGPSVKKEPKGDHHGGVSALMGRHGLRRLLFGSIRASDLTDAPTTGQQSLFIPSRKLHALLRPSSVHWSDQQHGERVLAIPQDNTSIYTKIVSAISLSVLFFLAKSNRYTPLFSNIFLVAKPSQETSGPSIEEQIAWPTMYKALRIEVQWLSCGSLIMYSYIDGSMSWLRQFDQNPRLWGLKPLELTLAPFGTAARPTDTGLEEEPSLLENIEGPTLAQTSSNHALKSSISILLEQHGILLAEHCQWLRINIIARSDEARAYDLSTPPSDEILWPAHLCFYEDSSAKYVTQKRPWLWPGLEKNAVDPLKAAEAWYLNKDIRQKQAEQRRRESEAQSRIQAQATLTEEDDITSGMFRKIDRHIEIQGINSIYPTPPDGFQSQLPAHPSDHESHHRPVLQGDVEMPDQGCTLDKHNEDSNAGLDSTPRVGLSLGAYETTEDDDFFGDMDSAMYTAKGITEDDFDFFDEPEEVEYARGQPLETKSIQQNVYVMDPMSTEITSDMHRDEEDHDMIAQEAQNLARRESTPTIEVVHSRKEVSMGTDGLPDHGSLQVLATAALPQLIKKDAPSLDDPTMTSEISTNHSCVPLEQHPTVGASVFGAVNIRDVSQTLDRKYAHLGRFSADYKRMEDHHTLAVSHVVEDSIPILAQIAVPDNDDLESDEEFESDKPATPSTMEYESDNGNTAINIVNLTQSSADAVLPIDESTVSPSGASRSQVRNKDMDAYPVTPSTSLGLGDEIYRGVSESFIAIAQILADQVLSYSDIDNQEELLPQEDQPSFEMALPFEDPLKIVLADLFSHEETCTLEVCASINGNPRATAQVPKAIARPIQRKQDSVMASNDAAGSSSSISEISIPHARVMRGDALMDISSTALQFWEELGLSPSSGPKNITAFCVHPDSEMVRRGVGSLMRSISAVYQSFRLGTHTCGNEDVGEYSDGLIPVPLDHRSMEDAASEIDTVCGHLGELLSDLASAGQTIVVYIVNPFCAISSLPRLCECFLQCFERYASSAKTYTQENPSDLVLKIIPIGLVASNTTIAVPSPNQYISLAKDVYDRCPIESSTGDLSPYASASLIQLAENIPKTLSFRLTADPTTSLSMDHETLHVGYSWKSDSQWLCSSITDNLGTLRWNASYSFGDTVSNAWPTLTHFIREIWSGVVDVIGRSSHKYSVYVVKDQPIDQKEIDAWLRVSTLPENPKVTLVVLCADESPPIYNSISVLSSLVLDDPTFYATPVSTPLPNAATPDNSASPGFPNAGTNIPRTYESLDAESGARILDVTDQSWGVVFSRALPTHNFGRSGSRYLGSGYLLKRAGGRDKNGWVMMGVYVIHAEKWTEASMKDLLSVYRSLATLARARGIEDSVRGILPWHIAVASKSRKALTSMMSYGDRQAI